MPSKSQLVCILIIKYFVIEFQQNSIYYRSMCIRITQTRQSTLGSKLYKEKITPGLLWIMIEVSDLSKERRVHDLVLNHVSLNFSHMTRIVRHLWNRIWCQCTCCIFKRGWFEDCGREGEDVGADYFFFLFRASILIWDIDQRCVGQGHPSDSREFITENGQDNSTHVRKSMGRLCATVTSR